MSLSILIPYYETYDLMMKLLKELNIQKTSRIEIILIDDGCNEARFDEFKNKNNFNELKIIHLPKNEGMSNALNIGLDNANGEYIAFVDSDDQITMDYIDILIETIDTHDEDIIYFNWADFNTNEIVRHPENYALWKAIYKKEIFPRFEKDRRVNNDVPVQKKLRNGNFYEFYLDRVLYIYNSNRVGSITWNNDKKKEIEK